MDVFATEKLESGDSDLLRVIAVEIGSQMATMRAMWGDSQPNIQNGDLFAEMAAHTVAIEKVDDSYEAIYTHAGNE